MRTIRIVSFVVLSLALFASQASAFGEIRYTDRPLNLRDGRSPKANWVGNMYPGQKVRIDHLVDGWVAVYEPDAVDNSESAAAGFANVKYLKKERTRYEPMEWGELKYAVRAINVRTKPSIKGKKIMTLKSWEHVLVDFPEGDWIMVFKPTATIRSHMNGIGYSSAKYFRPATDKTMASVGFNKDDAGEAKTEESPEPSEQAVAEAPAVSGEGQVSGTVAPPPDFIPPRLVQVRAKINVHADRTTGSSLVRTLKPGDRVKVGRAKHGWYGIYGEYERVHAQSRPMGYALESILDKGSEPAVPRSRSASAEALKSTPEPAAVPEPEPAPKAEPEPVKPAATVPTPEPAKPLAAQPDTGQQTMVIDRSKFKGKKRPDPTPDKTAHGYQYRFLEKSETRQLGEPWITLKVFLATTKLPDRQALEDFATTLWKEHRRVTKKVAVLVYLPGMDTEDLAYGVVKFDDAKLLELWVRKATLFGTKFL
ncbi:MAG: SH3 domain-containing protein [Desulfovibrionaceae bacterium]|nr:SH3 domain-containing protein [Desulfovibrionaceae bacterium]